MSEQLVEAVARAIEQQMYTTIIGKPGENMYSHVARAAIALIRPAVLEEAAKVCDVIEDKLTEQWKAGYKVCDYTQGASDGANDCAAAIRALKDKA